MYLFIVDVRFVSKSPSEWHHGEVQGLARVDHFDHDKWDAFDGCEKDNCGKLKLGTDTNVTRLNVFFRNYLYFLQNI